jgi:hypothetical protein
MSDGSVDALLRDLAAELQVEPAGDLAARVRHRLVQFSERRTTTNWTLGIAGVVLVSGLALTVDLQPPSEDRPAPGPAPFALEVSPGRVAPVGPVADVGSQRRPVPTRRVPIRASASHPAPVSVAAPEMIVPPDQAIALQRILAAMRTGQSPVPPAAVVTLDADGRMPAPAQIAIPEITIERLWPPANGGGSRER